MKTDMVISGWLRELHKEDEKEIILENPHLGRISALSLMKNFALANSFPDADCFYEPRNADLSSVRIPNCTLRIYATDEECNPETAMMAMDKAIYGGDLDIGVEWEGYSEYSVLDMWIDSATIGGHDLVAELESYMGKFLHIIVESSVDVPEEITVWRLKELCTDAITRLVHNKVDELTRKKGNKFSALSSESFKDYAFLCVLRELNMTFSEHENIVN